MTHARTHNPPKNKHPCITTPRHTAGTQLDTALQRLLAGGDDPARQQGISSRRLKWLRFYLAHHKEEPDISPMFPLKLRTICLYGLFLASPEGNVTGGFKSVNNYITELINLARSLGHNDPRASTERNAWIWKRYRQEFNKQIQVVRKFEKKLALQPAHLYCIIAAMDMSKLKDLKDAAMYSLLWHAGCRVSHVAAKLSNSMKHILRWSDLVFEPSVKQAQRVVIRFRSSKVLPECKKKEWWTALGKVQPKKGRPIVCPVSLIQAWFIRGYNNIPDAPVFGTGPGSTTPLGRNEFTRNFRTRLAAGAPLLAPPHNTLQTSQFSGVSFRRGCVSTLAKVLDFNRVRAHAGHSDPRSTVVYCQDSTERRAENCKKAHAVDQGTSTE